MLSGRPAASDVFVSLVINPRRFPTVVDWYPDGRLRPGLPRASELINSSVAVCRSCDSFPAIPNSIPCVKVFWLPDCAYAPSGANVTELFDGSSRQFDGTVTVNALPSL